jgi:hypothetical protein
MPPSMGVSELKRPKAAFDQLTAEERSSTGTTKKRRVFCAGQNGGKDTEEKRKAVRRS